VKYDEKAKWSEVQPEPGSGSRNRYRVVREKTGLIKIHHERVFLEPGSNLATGEALNSIYIHHTDDVRWIRDKLTELVDDIHDIEALKAEIAQLRYDRDDIAGLRQALEDLAGPHCSSCGYAIDPDVCHCGEDVDKHAGGFDSHAPVPMGCQCHMDGVGRATKDLLATIQRFRELTSAQRSALAIMGPIYEIAKKLVDDSDQVVSRPIKLHDELIEATRKAIEIERKRLHLAKLDGLIKRPV
jgi:hypothetical protein